MRVSVSDVDGYNYFLANESITLEELLARLRRTTQPTINMRAGTALHAILETSQPGELTEVERDGFKFRFDVDTTLALPEIRELKATGSYVVDGIQVTLVGRVDAIHGKRIYDHKLTSRFDAEKYADSFQWRAYLTLLGGDHFTYNVFTGSPKEDTWVIRAFDSLSFYRYPGMEADVLRQLSGFVRFIKMYLPEKLAA